MIQIFSFRAHWLLLVVLAVASITARADTLLEAFFGTYEGQATTDTQGTLSTRDMQVEIFPHKQGFTIKWVSISHKSDGRSKRKKYIIDFKPTRRPHIFQAGMRRNKFGHTVPLDPMRGEPYVWAHIDGPSLKVYALHVLADGGYEMQTYIRTVTRHGLDINYTRRHDGEIVRSATGSLKKLEVK